MATPKIILVGNGTSILDRENGLLIDSFQDVVRFNDYRIRGFEKHTGTRTTIWFNVCRGIKDWRVEVPYRHVYTHSWQRDPLKCETHTDFCKNLPPSVPRSKVDHAILDEIDTYSETKFRHYSTGLIAIWVLIKEFPEVTLTGFDWWERKDHHYGDKYTRGKLHDPQLEHQVILKLQREGKLRFL